MKLQAHARDWFEVDEVEKVSSPGLLIYRERLEANLKRMLEVAGSPHRLRPHIKTHKIRELLELQLALGISKFKCATIAEAELAAIAGAPDILLAYQPVGPATHRVAELCVHFPGTRFSVLVDDAEPLLELSQVIRSFRAKSEANSQWTLEVFLDLDVGQHRTGVLPGPKAIELYRLIAATPGLSPGGLHAYDGHLSLPDPVQRARACEEAFAPVVELQDQLLNAGLKVPRVIAGGTPTFAVHARRQSVECSPGTCVFWDAGYDDKLKDLPFEPAAVVLTRVVSKPGPGRLCLDLGHKAIASEMPHPRVRFLNLQDAHGVSHSEEHLVVSTECSAAFKVGDCLYGVPWHICPTIALHSEALLVEQGKVIGSWRVAARDRRLTI